MAPEERSPYVSVRSDGTTYSDSEDYGADFDSEEEAILTSLLTSAASLASSSSPLPSTAGRRGSGIHSLGRDAAAPPPPAPAPDRTGFPADRPLAYRMQDVGISDAQDRAPRVQLRDKRNLAAPHRAEHKAQTVAYGRARTRHDDSLAPESHDIGVSESRAQRQPHQPSTGAGSILHPRGDAPGTLSPPPPELPADGRERAMEIGVEPSISGRSMGRDALSPDAPASSSRSPLQRFRPRGRPLSVTDLVSPAWCEMQWAFTLARHGRKRATPAMASGTRVHQRLEAEVHTTVSVDVQSREDAFGLRIWNIIQGLQTLRKTGQTRELEVWEVLHGQLVNGVLDELSFICPDKDLEPQMLADSQPPDAKVPDDQAQMTDFFQPKKADQKHTTAQAAETLPEQPQPARSLKESLRSANKATPLKAPASQTSGRRLRRMESMRMKTSRIYICDVKTRAAPNMPQGAAFRPTFLQLMLYRLLLEQMVLGDASIVTLCRTLRLDPDASFSDSFIAQIIGLHETSDPVSSFTDADTDADADTGDMLDMLLTHNSLRRLWTLLGAELSRVFPAGAASLGDVLKVEYRNPGDGEIRGMKTFLFNRSLIEDYVATVLQWWQGEREPAGVVVEEAYKCRSCDFAADCTWRIDKEAQARDKYRMRTREGSQA